MEGNLFDVQAVRSPAHTAPVGRGALDHTLCFLSVDATLAALHGLPAADHLGQPLAAILPTLAPQITPLLRHVLTTGEPIVDIDVRGDLPDGRTCRWIASYYPVCTRAGMVIAVECAVRALDQRTPFTALTASQTALPKITDQMAFQATILANLNDAVIAVDLAERITYWGPGAERLYGFIADEVRGRLLSEVLRYQWLDPADEQAWYQALQSTGSWRGELRHIHRGGAPLTVALSVSVLTNDQGEWVGFLAIIRDMTDYRRAEITLLALATALGEALTPKQVAAVIFEKVHHAIGADLGAVVLLADDGKTLNVLETLGYSAIIDLIHEHLDLDMSFPLVDAVRSRQPIYVETPAEVAAHYPRLVEVFPQVGAAAALPLTIQQRVIGALGMIFTNPRAFSTDDRLYLQVAAQQCAQALERAWLYESEQRAHLAAEEAVSTRDKLLAMASHDLRNPLSIILGQAQLMIRHARRLGPPGEDLVRKLGIICTTVHQMDGQIEDLLDIARLRAGQSLALNLQPLDLVALTAEIVQATQAMTTRHQITFAAPDSAILCLGDQRRLARVFENLLSNAITYSPAGGPITLTIIRVVDNDGTWAVVSVQDTGLGIPADDMPHIFKRFHRGRNVVKQVHGTGLGLASVNQIVMQHEGRVHVVSEEGCGSTFTIYLPCLDQEGATPEAPAQ